MNPSRQPFRQLAALGPPSDVVRALQDHGRDHPSRDAIVTPGRRISWAEFDEASSRLALALRQHDVEPGHLVALTVDEQPEFLVLAAACWKIGAVPAAVNPRMARMEWVRLLDLAAPRLIVCGEASTPATWPQVELADLTSTQRQRDVSAALSDPPAMPWKAIRSDDPAGRATLVVDLQAPPTSSSLAKPLRIRPEGRTAISSPVEGNLGFTFAGLQLLAGGTVLVLPDLNAAAFLDMVAAESTTYAVLASTMLGQLHDHVKATDRAPDDLASLEVVLHSGGRTAPSLKRWGLKYFGSARLLELYGTTEVAGTLVDGAEWLERPGTVGRPLPGFTIEARSPEGHRLPPNDVGELWTCPPAGAQFACLGDEERILEGWVFTGDHGSVDADGYVSIASTAEHQADVIVSGGALINPAEVETAINEYPDVEDCAVVGLPHPEWGYSVHAIVQARTGADVSVDRLRTFCQERLVPYKVPKTFEFVPDLPRDVPVGTRRRSALRAARTVR